MRLPKWIFAALVPCLAAGISAEVAAFDLDASEYSLYETAPRSDGCRWLYIVPKSPLRILAADVPTPLLSRPDTTGFRGTLCGDGSVRDWRKEAVGAEDMASLAYRATPSSMKLLGGDFDGDGKPDFLLRAADRSRPSQLFIADEQGLPRNYVGASAGVATANVSARTVAAVPMAAAGAAQVSTVAATGATAFTVGLVGGIDGKFRVDESGAATYGVDILAAPGTAGVTPRISLNYASNAGDGIAGPGWSIRGLSVIERCRQTPAQDGNATAVSLNANDRFCLDGQRLILASGVYGGNGSTYRTEIDSYAVITAYGRVVGHPQYFTVRRKDGSLSYYGDGAAQGTNNSSPAAGIGGSVLRWGISRFQDSVGNGMRFQYAGDGVASDHRIARIDYAYGAAVGNAGNSTTFLQFDYQARPDGSSGYVAGLRLDRTQRLVAIRSFSNGTELRNYNLVYRAPDGVHRQSFVEKLYECAGSSCLSPTTFDWKLNQGGFTAGVILATVGGTQLSTVRTLDINGDGRTDIVYRKLAAPYGFYYRLSNGAGFAEERVLVPATTKFVNLDDLPVTIFDIDNDGRQDLLYATTPTTPAILFRGTPDGFAAGAAFDLGMAFPVAADISGDGVPDLAGTTIAPLLRVAQRVASNGNWTTVFGPPQLLAGTDGGGPAPPAGCKALSVWHMPASLMSEGSDFNGDGRVDLPAVADYNNGAVGCTATYAGVAISQGGGRFVSRSWVSGIALPAVDMNGDGLADQWYDDGAGNRVLRFSTGVSFAAPVIVGNSTLMQRALYVDYDGDGYPDLLWPSLFNALAFQRFDPAARGYPTAALTPLPFQAANGPFAADHYLSLDIDGDGHADLLRINNHLYGSTLTLYRSADAGGAGNRIVGIDNGLGGSTAIIYKPLTDGAVYTVGNDANKVASWPGTPVYDVLAPHYVVARVSIASPLANATVPGAVDHAALRTTEYRYGGFKLQSGGRGALGFAWIKTIDQRSGIANIAWYRQDFPFIGQPLWNLQASSAGVSVRSVVSRYGQVAHNGADGTRYYQIYESRREEQVNDLHSGVETSYVVTENAVPDEWGNFSRTTVSTFPAGSHDAWLTQRIVANSYGDTTYTRQFGRLAKSIDTYRRAGEPDIERISSFGYFPAGAALEGLLATERVDTADGVPTHTTSYRYDTFGNKTRVALNATGEAERYTDTAYDAAGRFVVSRSGEFYDGKGWSPRSIESVTSRNAYGQPLQIRFLNGLVVDYTYDAAGREIAHRENTGIAVRTEYLRGGAVGAQYQKKTTAATGAMAAEYFDALGRRMATAATGFDGRWIWSETEYDAQGRVQRQSEPHYAGEPAYWTRNIWDAFELLGRSAPATGGTEAATSIARQGLTTTTVNALGQKRIEERNAAGELVRATDALGGTVTYLYDAAGQVRQVTTSALQQGRTVSVDMRMVYDALGRKIQTIDSDKGTSFYRYNGFGEIVEQYKAMTPNRYEGSLAMAQAGAVPLQRICSSYDRRGRLVERVDYRANNTPETVARWEYDTQENGIGLLAQDYIDGRGVGHSYGYDAWGRPGARLTLNDDHYIEEVAYDGYGRIEIRTDGIDSGSGMRNRYNAWGYLESIEDLATRAPLYRVQARDARGHVVTATLGNGATLQWSFDAGSGLLLEQAAQRGSTALQKLAYTWDALGNPKSRWDRGIVMPSGARNLRQTFCHDDLNRLVKTLADTLAGNCGGSVAQQDLEYDGFGGIARKAGVGVYTYDTAHPRRLLRTGDGVGYTYDAVGNMTADSGGRSIDYTVFDKPSSIRRATQRIALDYGVDRELLKRTDSDGATGETTVTRRIGDIEKIVRADGSYDLRRHIAGIALWTQHFDSRGKPLGQQKYFMHRDAQGSLVMLTDETGAAKQQFSYDAWGRRVWVNNPALLLPSNALLPVAAQKTTEGFGGHDMLDAMGLVHMGGRIYDPRLGRFVQADPFVDAPGFLQAFNRYAYVFDMPLRFTDPNGFNGAGDDAMTLGSSLGNSPFGTGGAAVLPTVYSFAGYENTYTSFDAVNGYGFGGSALAFDFGNIAMATPKALSIFAAASTGATESRTSIRTTPRRSQARSAELGSAFLPGSAERSIDLDCRGGACFRRGIDEIYVTGHRIRGIGPYHTAVEYDGGDGVEWISAGFSGYTFEGMDRLVVGVGNLANGVRPTDAPSRNVALGRVIPPAGLGADEYFNRLKEAAAYYQKIAAGMQPMAGQGADSSPPVVDYDLIPSIANGYNSNSFLHGLLDATGGTTTIDMNDFIGGEKPVPAFYFGH